MARGEPLAFLILFHFPCLPALRALVGSAWEIARDRSVAEVEEVGFMAALSAAQEHVGFWDCYHGFGVFRASPPPTNKTWMADGDELSRRVRAAARRAIT